MQVLLFISHNLTQKMQLVVKLKQLLCKKWPLILNIFEGYYFYVKYVHCYKLRVLYINKILKALKIIYFFMLRQQKKIIPFVDVMKEMVK